MKAGRTMVYTWIVACWALPAPGAGGAARADDTRYRAGIGLLEKGVPDLAAVELEGFLKANPESADAANARYALGVCLVRVGRHAEGAAQLDLVIGLKGFELAADAAMLRASCHAGAGEHAACAAVLERLLVEHAGWARADHATALLGESLYHAGDVKRAREVLDSVVRRWPRSESVDRAELMGAIAASADGDATGAAERAGRLRERSPNGPLAAHAALTEARACHDLGKWARAAELYETAAIDASLRARATLGMAMTARAAGDAPRALRTLDGLVNGEGDGELAGAARLERVRALLDVGKNEDAMAAARELQRGAPDGLADDAAYWAARCQMKLGDARGAAAALADAIARYPKSELAAEMSFDHAGALARAGDDGAAIAALETWERVHEAHPLAPEAASARAACLHRTGEYERSLALCDEIVRRWPGHDRVRAARLLSAENAYLLGRYADAEAAYREFAREHPADPGAWRARVRRGLSLMKIGRAVEGVGELESALKEVNVSDASEAALARAALSAVADAAFAAGAWAEAEERYARLSEATGEAPGSADALLRRGLCLVRLGRADDAVLAFERAERAGPGSSAARHARFERGQALIESGRVEDARVAFEAVMDESPRGVDELAPHARRHLAAIASGQGRHEDAAALLSQGPGDTSGALVEQASAWLSAGKYELAERASERAIEVASGAAAGEARVLRAIAVNRQGRHEEALRELERVDAAPGALSVERRTEAQYERALALRSLGRDPEAAYRAVLEGAVTGPLVACSALDLAQLEYGAGRCVEAMALLDRCHGAASSLSAADRASVAAHEVLLRGACLLAMKQPAEAAEVLEGFDEAHPGSELSVHAVMTRAEALVQTGRAADAADQLERAVEHGVSAELTGAVLLMLGDARSAAQRWTDAERAYTQCLERDGGDERWYRARFGQGWCRERAGRYESAIESYREVTQHHRGATAARAQFQIGECLYAQKRHAEAVAELLKVDVLFASSEWTAAAIYEAGRCLAEMGRTAEALRQFEDVATRFPESKWAVQAKERSASVKPAASAGRVTAESGGG